MKPVVKLIFITLFSLTAISVNAQSKEPTIVIINPDNDEPTFTPSHLQAAEKFLITIGANKQFDTVADNLIATAGKQFTEDKKAILTDVVKKFMNKYLSWDVVRVDFSKIYAAEFSEEELRQLTIFFNTSTGKKYSEKMSALNDKGIMLGYQIVVKHQTELDQTFQQAIKSK